MYSENEIREALASITEIKQTLEGNLRKISPLFNRKGYISLCHTMGALLAVLFGAMILAERQWGTLGASPLAVRIALVVMGVLILAVTGFWKLYIFKRYANEKLGGLGVDAIFRMPEIKKLVYANYLILGSGAVVGCIYSYRMDNWWMLAPILYYVLAILCIYMSEMLSLKEYKWMGYMCLALALATSLFMRDHYLYWLGGSLCVMFFGMGIVLSVSASRHEQEIR